MKKVLITTVPFGERNQLPFELLQDAGIEYTVNPLNKKLTEAELSEMISDYDVLIAGTESITDKVMAKAPKLKLISRVGVGLDSVDLHAARRREINVSYTPEAPAPAVAELTMGLILTLLRSVHVSNMQLHKGHWQRIFGRRLTEITVGIIGAGRIGNRVIRRMRGFGTPRILVNDISPDYKSNSDFKLEWVTKEIIYSEADVISLHLPLTRLTRDMIKKEQLLSMKPDAIIINTSRGGIINEIDLYKVMRSGHLSGAAIDVFEQEPYAGQLAEIERCILTAHMGSMSVDCRTRMEIEATEEAVRFISEQILKRPVPEEEYEAQE